MELKSFPKFRMTLKSVTEYEIMHNDLDRIDQCLERQVSVKFDECSHGSWDQKELPCIKDLWEASTIQKN